MHIHVNSFQVCKQSICWWRTIIHHKVCKTESENVVPISELLLVNTSNLQNSYKSYIWFGIIWLLSVPSFLLKFGIWARLKTWFENVLTKCDGRPVWSSIWCLFTAEHKPSKRWLTTDFGKMYWPLFSPMLHDPSQTTSQKFASLECCERVRKVDFQFFLPNYTKRQRSTTAHISARITLYWVTLIFKPNMRTKWCRVALSVM